MKICNIGFNSGDKRTCINIDHDHKTKKVRGLLCMNCNFGIGSLKDDILILINAVDYLIEHEEVQ